MEFLEHTKENHAFINQIIHRQIDALENEYKYKKFTSISELPVWAKEPITYLIKKKMLEENFCLTYDQVTACAAVGKLNL